ncbi:MAG: ABC transporter ATP-binding protein [Deltaproteobacteria bacterium]
MDDSVPAIRVERLGKRFGTTVAVDDVSFEVGRGEVVGFLGPNGAGKSTTMRMLTGVFPPSSGRAFVAGHDVARDPLAARQAIGYLPERTALYGDMDVSGYLDFVAEMKRVDRAAVRSAVARAMDATAIGPVARRRIADLSKGYRQRVGIAQALLGDPPVLILDEPSSGLDPEQVSEIRQLVHGLGAERTVILSTHILSEVESTCSRVMVMNRGRILAVDEPHRLEGRLREHRETFVRVAGAEETARAALLGVPGVTGAVVAERGPDGIDWLVRSPQAVDPRREIAAAVVGAGLGLVEIHARPMSLEEIFLALVGKGDRGAPDGAPGGEIHARD